MQTLNNVAAAMASLAAVAMITVSAQTPQSGLPLEPARERGTGITPAYEGWYQNADGSYSMLVGYFNRNAKQTKTRWPN